MRLVQLQSGPLRRVAMVDEPKLRLIDGFSSIVAMAQAAIETGSLSALVESRLSGDMLDYDELENPAFDRSSR
jgi:hypothetical protein